MSFGSLFFWATSVGVLLVGGAYASTEEGRTMTAELLRHVEETAGRAAAGLEPPRLEPAPVEPSVEVNAAPRLPVADDAFTSGDGQLEMDGFAIGMPSWGEYDALADSGIVLDELTTVTESHEDGETLAASEPMALERGVRIDEETAVVEGEAAPSGAVASAERRARRARRRAPSRPPMPRLHSDPGMHTVMVARRMNAAGEAVQGSCYRYLSEVYARAGHSGWRRRTIVYRAEKNGPYANLDLIRPGDWLYIVTDPTSDPVFTHSVMFVGWQDRARGYARTISHAGWGPPRTGRESSYDVSRTYRIIRPTL
ncbi:MAG: hypothetical protein AAF938_21705 [Myxococcota bacterium]